MSDATPTLLRRRLGVMLKTMRVRAGLNLAEGAKRLGTTGPTLSKIEHGRLRPDLKKFFTAYQVTDAARIAETMEIAKIANSTRQRSIFAQYRDVIRPRFADFIELEEIATRTDCYAALAIPGLLQTAAYARAVIEGGGVWSTPRDVRDFIELRMRRQDILAATGSGAARPPLSLRCILDEACLRREMGGPEILRDQLDHLVGMSAEPNIELRVLPFKAGAHTGIDGAYTVFHFEVGDPVVAVESLASSLYLDDDARVTRFTTSFDHLRAQSLDAEASRSFITGIAKEAL
ncbi:helix-turn-helix domain-containing protein [Streptomyces telluris]|uniref:Helix-turn-helix domain-containing protein n=1 Tax=Streptomyces telluris TaxID=2720021 RepID=A0A9X2LDN6_9ACTN|nr:helix-turn-helix transcriptional regulator [Streptomyces telluris]MCQ8769238.1 helix-turn-helix domain-containing protein [Streptomyces telluris]NJP80804.1 helix-turn-helix domain-containing protein [Streptomyces telluris]